MVSYNFSSLLLHWYSLLTPQHPNQVEMMLWVRLPFDVSSLAARVSNEPMNFFQSVVVDRINQIMVQAVQKNNRIFFCFPLVIIAIYFWWLALNNKNIVIIRSWFSRWSTTRRSFSRKILLSQCGIITLGFDRFFLLLMGMNTDWFVSRRKFLRVTTGMRCFDWASHRWTGRRTLLSAINPFRCWNHKWSCCGTFNNECRRFIDTEQKKYYRDT